MMTRINFALLKQDVVSCVEKYGVSVLARKSMVSNSTISRMCISSNRITSDFDTIVKIANGLGKPIQRYIDEPQKLISYYQNDDTIDKIDAILSADSNLSKEARVGIIDLMRVAYNEFTK